MGFLRRLSWAAVRTAAVWLTLVLSLGGSGYFGYEGLRQRSWERRIADGSIVDQPQLDRKSTRLNSSHIQKSRMPSSA